MSLLVLVSTAADDVDVDLLVGDGTLTGVTVHTLTPIDDDTLVFVPDKSIVDNVDVACAGGADDGGASIEV